MKYFVFGFFLLFPSLGYSVEPMTNPGDTRIKIGKDLLINCQEMSNLDIQDDQTIIRIVRSTLCGGYINGFLEADGLNNIDNPNMGYCLPSKLADIKLADAITQHLRKHPELYNLPPSAAIMAALNASYPCKK